MANIDIPLPDALTKALTAPKCLDMRLPKASKVQIRLPLGGTIKPIPDITKGIPSNCSLTFNMALQIAPIMASIECLMKVLKFIGAIIDAINGFKESGPLSIPESIDKLLEAAKDVAGCVAQVAVPPLGIIPFVKDLLLMIARILRCIVEALKSIVEIMGGLELQMATARQNGNDELLAQLACAKENAEIAAAGQMQALEPIQILLDLAKPFFTLGNIPVIELPAFGSETDIDSLSTLLETLETVLGAVETAAEAIPA
jgi:hypothetical protein